jgi:hypothetical protein
MTLAADLLENIPNSHGQTLGVPVSNKHYAPRFHLHIDIISVCFSPNRY